MNTAPTVSDATVREVDRTGRHRTAPWLAAGLAFSLLLTFASVLVGTSSVRTSIAWMLSPDSQSSTVLWEIRLPRAVGAWFAGALLGLGGALTQGLFRNALAEPYLLGSASGAALGVTLSLLTAQASLTQLGIAGQLGVTGAAFVGAIAAICLTVALSRGALQTSSLLLAGIVVGFVLGAITSLLLLGSPESWRTMQSFLLGSTGYVNARSSMALGVVFIVCLVPSLLLARGLDALTLGEDTARSLGISLSTLRIGLLAILSLSTATTVSQMGIIGFVGLVAPHLVRETLRIDQRQFLLAAPICGGCLLQAADLVSRSVLRPAELPVGIVTACIGGTYLVILLWRRSRRA